jgi:hypothetical protein
MTRRRPRVPTIRAVTDGSDTSDEPTGTADDADQAEHSEQRLRQLEAAEDRYENERRLDRRFELFEAILLSIAAVLAAWAGFQSSQWSGEADDAYNRASELRVEAAQMSDRSGQEQVADLITFTEWLAAAEREGLLSATSGPGEDGYEPDETLLSGFLYERFRPEFKVAVDAWVATGPRVNPAAPPTPFGMDEYELASDAAEVRFEREAEAATDEARIANDRSDDYVLLTIVFATVLFFAGISSKMDTAKARVFLLTVGGLLLGVSAVIMISLPKAF